MNTLNKTLSSKRGLAYVRISSKRQINNESPETQKEAIQRYADSENISIVDWYYDEAKSGKNTDREELQNLLKRAIDKKDQIDHVIVYKMNRASRDLDTYVSGVRTVLKTAGITMRSATEPIDDTKTGRFLESLMVLLGQLDNDGKTEYTVDNMTALAMQGYWQHPPIVGYDTAKISNDLGKQRPTLKPNSKAPLVKDVLERFSEGDITKAELTRYAKEIGLRSRYGKVISEDSINRLIKSPTYAGFVADKFTSYEPVEGKHDPIISKDTYEQNQYLLYGSKTRKGEEHKTQNPEYPLKGILLCSHCRKQMYASAPKTGAGGYSPRYHCSRASCKGVAKSVKAEVVHKDFTELLERVKPENELLSLYKEVLVFEASNGLERLNTKIARKRKELDEVADSRIKAIRNYNEGALTIEEKNDLVKSLDQDKASVNKDLREFEGIQTVQEADIDYAIDVMEKVNLQWLDASIVSRQRFQNMLFPEGLVYDQNDHRFGTTQMSELYRCISTKKDLPEPEKSFLVAGAGLEPATLWL